MGSLPASSRLGYALNGWWDDESGDEITSGTEVKGNATYYAHWNSVKYQITYELRGGIVSGNPSKYAIDTPTFTLNNPTYQGRTFIGWTGSNGNTPQLSVSIPKGSTGNKSYAANWDVRAYTVKFDNNEEIGTMDDQIFQYDVFQKLSKNTFIGQVVVQFDGNGGVPETNRIVSFKEFIGWARSQGGSVEYRDEANVKNLTSGSEITLYAKWGTPNKIYLPNAGRVGYSLLGWYTDPEQEETNPPTAGDEYQPTVDTTLYAHWSGRSYTVTFDPTTGTVSPTSKSVTFDQPYGNLPEPEHEEFAFNGWFTQNEGGDEVTKNTQVTTPRDHTLYAHWKDGKMTLTFDADGGDLPDGVGETRRCWIGKPYSYERNTPPGEFPTPERTGY